MGIGNHMFCRNPHPQLCSRVHCWGCWDRNQGGFCLLRHGYDGTACQGRTNFTLEWMQPSPAWCLGGVGGSLPRDVFREECGFVGHTHSLGPRRLHAVCALQHPQLGLRQADPRRLSGRDNKVHRNCPRCSGSRKVSLAVMIELWILCRVVLVESEVEEQASINRSPTSYDANPEEERARWAVYQK